MSQSGIAATIDVATGELGIGRSMAWSAKTFSRHPGTGTYITGQKLPCWAKLVPAVQAAAASLPTYT